MGMREIVIGKSRECNLALVGDEQGERQLVIITAKRKSSARRMTTAEESEIDVAKMYVLMTAEKMFSMITMEGVERGRRKEVTARLTRLRPVRRGHCNQRAARPFLFQVWMNSAQKLLIYVEKLE